MLTPDTDRETAASASRLAPEVTVIIVSYNTRELTLRAIETLLAQAGNVAMRVIVWDNASHDGSADAIAARFPQLELIRSSENIGFARANNAAAETATSEFLLLLNPDTETHPRAIELLLAFARANPHAGIVGGRTVFPDGSLNPSSCWNQITLWSLFASAVGLTALFPHSPLFNSEGIGGWKRDSERQVDIVVGCFFLIRTALWRQLGGFDRRYFMYGEEADLCLRAARLGHAAMITPEAQIMHLVGASTAERADKVIAVTKARATLVRDHWTGPRAWLGLALMRLGAAVRRLAYQIAGPAEKRTLWQTVWARRSDWLSGY